MCGRYVLYGPQSRLVERFELAACPDFAPRWNIPPQTEVLVLRQRPDVGRVGQLVKWGLVPGWAKDPSIGGKLNNARAEGIAAKPSFRSSFAKHRCLIPANGFYEWKAITEGSRVRKQPYYIRPREDGEFFAMAGLLARWRTPDGQDLVTTCVITTAPNEVLAPIHDRMPVLLSDADFEAWLDPENHDTAALEALLKPAPPGDMKACAVGTAVSRAGNEGETCIAPLEPGDA
jgi:putative SOS response-associated peptidase YedK